MKASGNPVIFFLMGTLYSMIYVPAMSQSSYAFELTFQEVEGLYGRAIGKIRNITQDPYGYMWFSGEEEKCIYRYDGNKLTLFRKDNLNTNSLGGVNVNDIYADDKGIIWIAFGGTGMDSFDPSSNTFKHYRHDEVDQRSIASDNVNCIFKDSRGRIWVGTDEGLDQLNEATGEFTHFRHDPDNPRAISHNFISTVYEDRQRTIWVATAGYPWIVPDTNEGGLNRLQEDGTFTRFKHDPNDENSLISNHVLTLFEDSRGVFWVGTDGNGLHTMDRKTGKFQRYLYDPAHPQKLSRPPLKSDDFCKAFDVITFIVEDHSGAIWIGSMCSGINRYDPKNGKVTRYENSNGYPENTTWNGFVSRDGVLWICSQQNKLYRINPVRKVFKRVKLGAGVARFQPDNNGMWIGGEKGLLLVDSAGAILKTILIKNENNSAVSLTEVHRDSENKLWLGAADGVYVFDTNTEQYQHLDVDFTMGAVLHIKQDQSNPDWKWAASLEGGLLKFSRTGRLLRRYTFDKNDSSSIASDHIIFVIDDKDCLWIGTVSGISRLNKKSDRFKNYPSLKSTYAFKDSHGVIWAGSENGLFQYDDKLDKFIGVGYHSVVTTDRTYGITEDDHKNLWVSTPSTIVRIDSSRKLISQFGTENGIEQSSISPGAVYKTKGGEVFFGNYDGYYIIDPDQFSEFEKPQQILFNDFIVNPNSGKFPVDLIQKPVGELAPISLHHDQNSFSISFFFPDYREPRGNHFEVRLLGYDDTWRD